VTFRANRLVIGDPRFDQEFKVDLIANMSSKVTQQATLVTAEAATDAPADNSPGAAAGSSPAIEQQQQQPPSAAEQTAASAAAEDPAAAAAAEQQAPAWQRMSSLACKVKLSMTLRMPHPLSIVPGPLLSTTAGLVAKLVMQALLPSFLELLATDYARWAAGSSTQARQALPAGSLVAAGKQQLQQAQERQQQQQAEVLPAQQ
jgi:hypothetical protein